MVPTPIYLGNDVFRIFFGTRNYDKQSCIAYAEISLKKKITILRYSKKPSLKKGELGAFDDNGVLPSCIIKKKKIFFNVLYWVATKSNNAIFINCGSGNFKRWKKF